MVLFVAAFNVLLEYVSAGQSTRYVMEKGGPIELLRAFMDDVSILTGPIEAAKEALARSDPAVKWGRMALKPPKSRGLVVMKSTSVCSGSFCSEVLQAILRNLFQQAGSKLSSRYVLGQ